MGVPRPIVERQSEGVHDPNGAGASLEMKSIVRRRALAGAPPY
jgi:hypothetical protein